MNRMNIRRMKPVVIVALVLILSAATCFAATKITSMTSVSKDAFDQFPTSSQVEKAVNYVPDYVENFSNGFYFKNASVSENTATDADNNKVNESKGITFFYTKDGAQKEQMLTLSTDAVIPETIGKPGPNTEVIKDGNLDLIYSQVTMKVVPNDYTPTEEENQQVEQGVLWISAGSDKVEVSNIQYVSWVKDGIAYSLTNQGFDLGKDEILGMVKEVLR